MTRRRTVLRGAAAALAGAGVAAAGLEATSDAASAQATTALDVADDRVLVGADGSVAAVNLSVDVEWAFELPQGVQPATVIVELAAGTDGTEVVATDESAEMFREADGTTTLSAELLAAGVLEAAALAPEAGVRETEVTVAARLRVENGDGDAVAEAESTDTAVVTVERDGYDAAEYGSVGGTGTLTIETA